MASAGEKELHAALTKRVFDPVYYFHGDDDYLKDARVRDLVAAAVDPATKDFNLDIRRGNELDAETLDSLLSTPPMLAERRVAVVRDADKLKKDARRVLDGYLKRPASDTVLVLTSPSGVKADKGFLDASTVVEFAPLSGSRVNKWITWHVEKVLERTITPDAATLLIEGVGDDLQQLSVELEKLSSFTDGLIDEAAVGAVVGIRKGESVGAFLDAMAARDTSTAIALLPGVLQIPKMNAVLLVMQLTTQTIAIAFGVATMARGVQRQALYNEYMGFIKSTGAFLNRAWGEAIGAWTKSTDQWTTADVDAALAALLDTDEALKDTKVSSEVQLLTTLILRMCASRTLQRAS